MLQRTRARNVLYLHGTYTGQARTRRTKRMYRNQLQREVRPIAQHQQEFIRDFAALWAYLMTQFRFKAKAPTADAHRR